MTLSIEDRAQLKLITNQAVEIAGLLTEMLMLAKQCNPEASIAEMTGDMVERLLTAGWQMSLFAFNGERERAKACYVPLLRAVADSIETAA